MERKQFICSLLIMFLWTIVFLSVTNSANAQGEESKKKWVENAKQQVSGWEWLFMERPTVSQIHYPVDVTYAKYASHPQYHITFYNTSNPSVYDEKGKLLREIFPAFNKISLPLIDDIKIEKGKKYIKEEERYQNAIEDLRKIVNIVNSSGKYYLFIDSAMYYPERDRSKGIMLTEKKGNNWYLSNVNKRLEKITTLGVSHYFTDIGECITIKDMFKESQNIFTGLSRYGDFAADSNSVSCKVATKYWYGLGPIKKGKISDFQSYITMLNLHSKIWRMEYKLPTDDDEYCKVYFKFKNPIEYEYISKSGSRELSTEIFWDNVEDMSYKTDWEKMEPGMSLKSSSLSKIEDKIIKCLMVNDYKNNMYGIQNESANVKKALELKLGLRQEDKDLADRQIYQIMKLLGIPYSPKMTKAQIRNAYKKKYPYYSDQEIIQQLMLAYATVLSREEQPQAIEKYIEQLNSDYKSDFETVPMIERIDDLRFRVTYDIKCRGIRAIAIITFYSDKPYTCNYRSSISLNK